jgi:NADP-dependent 3-hydroxy acid dehydrogenase YdfG
MTSKLQGKIAWVTGAGSGIGAAAARRLAGEGAHVVLTGRRREPLTEVAGAISSAGGSASVAPGDLMQKDTAARIVSELLARHGRLDLLVNNAGLNIQARTWKQLSPDGIDELIRGNLSSAFWCTAAALAPMRAAGDGVLIHTSSMSGRFISPLSGPGYTAAKHGVCAMSHTINIEECVHGIRSTVICPGEVATPILDQRPVPVSPEERARMVQPEDVADLILYVATLPPHVCLNEVLITPTWNRGYVALRQQGHVKV